MAPGSHEASGAAEALCLVQKQYVPNLSLASLTLSVFELHGGRGWVEKPGLKT